MKVVSRAIACVHTMIIEAWLRPVSYFAELSSAGNVTSYCNW